MKKNEERGIVIQNHSLDVIKNVVVASTVLGIGITLATAVSYGVFLYKIFKSEKNNSDISKKDGLDNFESVKAHLEYPSEFVEDELRKHNVETTSPLVDNSDVEFATTHNHECPYVDIFESVKEDQNIDGINCHEDNATYLRGRLVDEDGYPLKEGDTVKFNEHQDVDVEKDSPKKKTKSKSKKEEPKQF